MARMSRPCFKFSIVLSALLLLSGVGVEAQKRLLTVEDIYHPEKQLDFEGRPLPRFSWSKNGIELLVKAGTDRMRRVDARSGSGQPVFALADLEKGFSRLPEFSQEAAADAAKNGELTLDPSESSLLVEWKGDLFAFNLETKNVVRLTSDTADKEVVEFSPSGKLVSFVRDNDLYVVSAEGGRERRITANGGPNLLNGILDWVYEEEVFSRGSRKGAWWSPDSKHIAFFQLDETGVPEFTLARHEGVHPTVEITHYPKAGDPNPTVRLGIAPVAGGDVVWADLSEYSREEFLIVSVSWTRSGDRVFCQVQNRKQTWLDLLSIDPDNGSSSKLFRETTPAWVDPLGPPLELQDGSFLWLSDKSGYRHIYHVGKDGKELAQLTKGEWTVAKIEAVDEKSGKVFFSANRDKAIERHLYTIPLGGGEIVRVTSEEGSHYLSFNNDASLFLDSWTSTKVPGVLVLREASGGSIREIARRGTDLLKEFDFTDPQFVKVPTCDGFLMEAMLIRPPNFDPDRRYPVLVSVYGGPQAPQVQNRWGSKGFLWNQLLAQKGYLIWVVDNRSASGKGAVSAWPAYRKLGTTELQDIEDSLAWLRSQSWVDPARIGIWGWSYGGYFTSYALTHSTSFRVGIAGAPVTDWHLYDSIYTERYMDLPQDNPEGYADSSVVRAAQDLHGKLLVIHGTVDDNVHPQNTLQFIEALQKAGKDFDLMFYPGSRHGVQERRQAFHLRKLMTDFILENL